MVWVNMECLFVSDICRCQGEKAQMMQVEISNLRIRLMSFFKLLTANTNFMLRIFILALF